MNPNARNAYMSASVSTANPHRLLVMLCDRLVLDVKRGIEAQKAADHDEASKQLLHAQEIVNELRFSLKPELFPAGPQLAALYDWLFMELVKANVSRDVAVTEGCLGIIEPIADTWREAAVVAAGEAPTV